MLLWLVSAADCGRPCVCSLGAPELVIKAQVLAGGRGKGHFAGVNGLKGGVQMVHRFVPPLFLCSLKSGALMGTCNRCA